MSGEIIHTIGYARVLASSIRSGQTCGEDEGIVTAEVQREDV